jgi:hypothetical protein
MGLAMQTTGDVNIQGVITCTQISPNQACIGDGQINASSAQPINGSKVQHENPGITGGVQLFGPTTTVATVTQTLGMAINGGVVQLFKCWIEVAAVGAATVTLDLQKSTGGGAYATILTGLITLNNATVIRIAASGTLTGGATYVAGDILRTVVTATAGGGTLPQGLTLILQTKENPT